MKLVTIDGCGSFRTEDGRFEAICWTHRGSGWDIHSTTDASVGCYAPNKREAQRKVRELVRASNDTS